MAHGAPPKTLQEAILYFADADRCLAFMVQLRWPEDVVCPTCGSKAVMFLKTRRIWKCSNDHKRRQFSIKVGTIFEDSPIPLEKWLPCIWMIANCKNGVSSYEIHRALGVTQKTAWFMLHRIRLAMHTGTFDKLKGTVEVDETFIGGQARFMSRSRHAAAVKTSSPYGQGKAIVFGMLERQGRVVAKVVPDTKRRTLLPEISEHVERGSGIHSDGSIAYISLQKPHYFHEAVDHEAGEYVRGHVHVNGIENFWALLKRALKGTYISVEPFHLFRYLDEQVFRFNERKNKDGDQGRFVNVASDVFGKRLAYKTLIGQSEGAAALG